MRKIAFLLCLVSTSALAQQQPAQPYSPITLDQKDYENLRKGLGQARFDDALPIILMLENMERAAQIAETKARIKNSAETKPQEK